MRKGYIYETIDGDTWDKISFDFYGSEKFAPLLMQMNFKHIDTIIFEANIKILVPELSEKLMNEENIVVPPWR